MVLLGVATDKPRLKSGTKKAAAAAFYTKLLVLVRQDFEEVVAGHEVVFEHAFFQSREF